MEVTAFYDTKKIQIPDNSAQLICIVIVSFFVSFFMINTHLYCSTTILYKKTGCIIFCISRNKTISPSYALVKGTRKSLVSYLVKYVSKNEIEFYRLPWHCSIDVSRLFTAINFDESEEDKLYEHLPEDPEQYITKQEKYYTVQGFKFTPKEIIFSDLDGVNETVYGTNN